MTGPLVLAGNPASPLEAATESGASIHLFVLVSAVSDAGGTFTPRVDCHAHYN